MWTTETQYKEKIKVVCKPYSDGEVRVKDGESTITRSFSNIKSIEITDAGDLLMLRTESVTCFAKGYWISFFVNTKNGITAES